MKNLKGNLILTLTAFIWGTAFVAQKEGMDLIGPIAFNGIRTVIGGIILLPVIWFMSKLNKNKTDPDDRSPEEIAEAKKDPKILHSTGVLGIKPWQKNRINPFNDVFMKYIYEVNPEFTKEELSLLKRALYIIHYLSLFGKRKM